MSTQPSLSSRDVSQVLGRILRAPVNPQTYRNLCYLMVMFPLGIVYFTLLAVGFTTGVALVIIVIGLPIIVLSLAVVVGFARLERTLVRVLFPPRLLRPTTAFGSD